MTPPRYPQNHYIGQIIEYAKTKIPAEESSIVGIKTFKSLNQVVKYIATKEGIRETKVYPALRMLGYNKRYSDMKRGNPDGIYAMSDLVNIAVMSLNPSLMDEAMNYRTLFDDMRTKNFRIHKSAIEVASKDADESGIEINSLNLYNVLTGLELLVNEEPDYIRVRDERIFAAPMVIFGDAKDTIRHKQIGLEAILANR